MGLTNRPIRHTDTLFSMSQAICAGKPEFWNFQLESTYTYFSLDSKFSSFFDSKYCFCLFLYEKCFISFPDLDILSEDHANAGCNRNDILLIAKKLTCFVDNVVIQSLKKRVSFVAS